MDVLKFLGKRIYKEGWQSTIGFVKQIDKFDTFTYILKVYILKY